MKRWWSCLQFWDHPLVRRRFREAPRSASALALMIALGLICGGVMAGRWVSYGTATVSLLFFNALPSSASAMNLGPLESLPAELMGRQFVRDLGMVVVLLLFLIAPGTTGQNYAEQRKHNTFDLLMLTPLRPASIVLGDWLGHAFPLSLVCLVTLPFFVVSIAYGGVSLVEVGCILVLVFALAFSMTSVGLFCSTLGESSSGSAIAAYFLCTPLAVAALLGIEVLAVGPGNFLGIRSRLLPTEVAVMLYALIVSILMALNSLWWAIADFEYLHYQRRGDPVPGQRERFLEEGL